jgi:hypothetical protein
MCVFEKASPSAQKVIQDIKEDARLWCLAGAKGLSRLRAEQIVALAALGGVQS